MKEHIQNLYKPSFLKELCQQYGLTPSKSYGQNYLVQSHPIEAMVEVAEISKNDTIIEVGPGFGVLTFALAAHAKKVYAFEIERKLEAYWDEHKPENVDIIWGDALVHLKETLKKIEGPYKVVANLPYQITSKLLRTFLELGNQPECIVVMVQKEVAERIVAGPGDMSLLSTSVQFYGVPRMVKKVSKGNFWPSPKVDSAVLAISDIERPAGADRFFEILKAAYAQKRKQAWKNISHGVGVEGDHIKRILHEVTGNEKIRAEEVSVSNWKTIVEQV